MCFLSLVLRMGVRVGIVRMRCMCVSMCICRVRKSRVSISGVPMPRISGMRWGVTDMSVMAVVPGMSARVMSIATVTCETANRHSGESNSAERERGQVYVHVLTLRGASPRATSGRVGQLVTASGRVAAPVNDDRRRKNQYRILGVCNVETVGIGEAEPLLGNACDLLISAPERVLVVEEVALHRQVVRSRNVDRERVVKKRERVFSHNGDQSAALEDLVGPSPRENLLLDECELCSSQVMKKEPVSNGEDRP